MCSRGKYIANCSIWAPLREAGARKSKIGTSGAWQIDGGSIYDLDTGLLRGLAHLFSNASLLELGAGVGCYAHALRTQHGMADVRACDGAPGIERATDGAVCQADLTLPLQLPPADWVMSLEVGEHLPPSSSFSYLQTLRQHSRRGLVLSWSSSGSGHGHINPQHHWRVVAEMGNLGFRHDLNKSLALRRASSLWWMREGVQVFWRESDSPLDNATCKFICGQHFR